MYFQNLTDHYVLQGQDGGDKKEDEDEDADNENVEEEEEESGDDDYAKVYKTHLILKTWVKWVMGRAVLG